MIEQKVKAATAGAGGATVVGNFLLWVLSHYAFHGTVAPEVSGFVSLATGAGGAFVGGWFAKHTPRPDLAAPPTSTTA